MDLVAICSISVGLGIFWVFLLGGGLLVVLNFLAIDLYLLFGGNHKKFMISQYSLIRLNLDLMYFVILLLLISISLEDKCIGYILIDLILQQHIHNIIVISNRLDISIHLHNLISLKSE